MSTDPDTPPPPPAEETTPQAAPEAAPQTSAAPVPAPAAPGVKPEGAEKKLVAGLLAILIGSLGIHKFYLGYQKEGLIMVLVTVLTCGFGGMVSGIIGLIEGIMYLTKTDEDFVATYVTGRKPWF